MTVMPGQTGVSVGPDLVLFFVVGLLAGAHCLGMCGPLVSLYAERMTSNRRTTDENRVTYFEVRQHALFNVGRTVGYAIVGGIVGFLGGTVVESVEILLPVATTVRGSVGIVVGLFIGATGLGYLLGGTTATTALPSLPLFGRLFSSLSDLLTARTDRVANSTGIAGVGVVHSLLPCPILYPAYLYAFAVGDPLRGALALGLLGLGTIPALLVYGLALGTLSVDHRQTLHRVLGVTFLLLGYLPLAHGLMLLGVSLPSPNIPYYQPL